jgi:phytoene dehydrogenase-like protein
MLLSSKAISSYAEDNVYDVIVIGSGIGGLSCSSILASQGFRVCVCESHYEIGGVAHEFLCTEDGRRIASDQTHKFDSDEMRKLYRFEVGPSLYSGLSSDQSPNPLKHVFQIIGEEPEWIKYRVWKAFIPEAPDGYDLSIGATEFEGILLKYGGQSAVDEWRILSSSIRPLTKGVMSFPSMAIRPDLGALRTFVLRYPSATIDLIRQGSRLVRPFAAVYEELGIKNEFLKNYLNLLCFLLQGLPAEGTLSAVMAYMVEDFFRPNAVMDFPVVSEIIDALL